MLNLTVKSKEKKADELADTLELIASQLRQGFTEGRNRREDGVAFYSYEVEGKEEEDA